MSAIQPETGKVLWRTDVYGWTFGTPLLVGDRIFVGAAGGEPRAHTNESPARPPWRETW